MYSLVVLINTYYYNSNLIWCTVSCRVDEVIPLDHARREASRVIKWYDLIHNMFIIYLFSDIILIL